MSGLCGLPDLIGAYDLTRPTGSNSTELGALATDAAGELDVLGHDGDALCVDGAEVGVLKEADQVRLRRLQVCT